MQVIKKISLRKIARWIVYTFISIVLLIVFYLNIRLYYAPAYLNENEIIVNKDVLLQLHYLKQCLHHGGGELAQQKYPEGYVFINVLYGLTWADFIAKFPSNNTLYKEGIEEINWAYQELNSNNAKMWFPDQLVPSKGIFYRGWKNYLLGKKLSVQETTVDSLLFVQECDSIYQAFLHTEGAYLESYIELVWPADNMVAIAALALHDQLYQPKYAPFIQNWVGKIKEKLDPATKLIPHEVVYKTEKTLEGAKGSSQSLMLNFLIKIDSNFAQQQFQLYREKFLDYRFGLPGIREYPKGSNGGMDVDSGPVILEIGGAASLVGQRTMALYRDVETSVGLRNSIESFGAAYTSNGQKRYVFGLEPIADAFIAWANVVDIQEEEKLIGNWRWTFQLLSIGILVLAFGIRYFLNGKWKTENGK